MYALGWHTVYRHTSSSGLSMNASASASCVCVLQMHAKFVQLLALDAPDVGDLREALTGLVADFNSSQQEPRWGGGLEPWKAGAGAGLGVLVVQLSLRPWVRRRMGRAGKSWSCDHGLQCHMAALWISLQLLRAKHVCRVLVVSLRGPGPRSA